MWVSFFPPAEFSPGFEFFRTRLIEGSDFDDVVPGLLSDFNRTDVAPVLWDEEEAWKSDLLQEELRVVKDVETCNQYFD